MSTLRSLGLIFTFLFLLNACQDDPQAQAELYSAIPAKATLVVETRDLQEGLKEIAASRLYQQLDSLSIFSEFADEVKQLQALFAADSLEHFFDDRRIVMALAISGADKFDLVFATQSDPNFEQSLGSKLSKAFTASQRNYSGASIFQFKSKDGEGQYFVSSHNGVLLLSSNSPLLEECIRQLQSEHNILQQADFSRLLKTASTRDMANVYLNLSELPAFLQKQLPGLSAEVVARLGSWSELDLQVYDQELILNGLTLLPSDAPFFLKSFQGVKAQAAEGDAIVPSGSGLWLSLTFANADRYYRNYRDYLQSAGRLRRHDQLLEKLPGKPESLLLHWVDNEMGLFAAAGKAGVSNYAAYLAYNDQELTRQKLDSMSEGDFIEGYRGVIIRRLEAENALARFYGPLFEAQHQPYYILYEGFAIFAESLPYLKGCINDLLDGKTLARDEDFQQFNRKLPGAAHLRAVALNPGFIPMLQNVLPAEGARELEQQKSGLQNFRFAALQFEVEDDAALSNLYLRHAERKKELVSRIWSTQLQSEAVSTPQFLRNHSNGRYDIAIQDADHRLYLIDHSGKILWTKMLDGPIMGQINQVDGFKNNKLQMLFNTRNQLYLVDILGRDVENFPVALPAGATAPVGVFNYDGARNYRIVVPSSRKLLNYDISGKQVKGWNFKEAESDLITQPQHFSVAGKDVIVVETAAGKLLQLNRRGELRFETISDLPQLRIPFYLKQSDALATSEMLTIADDGQLYAFHPGGTADQLYLEADHPAEHFLFFDEKYIFSSDDQLFVKSDDQPWQAELEGDISSKPKAMIFKGQFYVGAYSAEAEEIRLYNQEGQLLSGFPVFAQGPFDMGSLQGNSDINLVTYSADGTVICYRVE